MTEAIAGGASTHGVADSGQQDAAQGSEVVYQRMIAAGLLAGMMVVAGPALANEGRCTRGQAVRDLIDAGMVSMASHRRGDQCRFTGVGSDIRATWRQALFLAALAGNCRGIAMEVDPKQDTRMGIRIPERCLVDTDPPDAPPVGWWPLSSPPPRYPQEAYKQGLKGTTVVLVVINREGRVTGRIIAESSGHPTLDAAAVDAASAWTFTSKRGDPPDISLARIPVNFDF